MQFEDELFESIYRDIILKVLTFIPPAEKGILEINSYTDMRLSYPGLTAAYDILYCKDGYIINMPFFKNKALNRNIIYFTVDPFELHKHKTMKVKLTSQMVSFKIPSMSAAKYMEEREAVVGYESRPSQLVEKYIENNIRSINKVGYSLKYEISSIHSSKVYNVREKKFISYCEKLLGDDTLIPYKIEDRKLKFENAFKKLNIKVV